MSSSTRRTRAILASRQLQKRSWRPLPDGILLWQVACEFLAASRKLEPFGYSLREACEDIEELGGTWSTVPPRWEVQARLPTDPALQHLLLGCATAQRMQRCRDRAAVFRGPRYARRDRRAGNSQSVPKRLTGNQRLSQPRFQNPDHGKVLIQVRPIDVMNPIIILRISVPSWNKSPNSSLLMYFRSYAAQRCDWVSFKLPLA